MYESGDEPKVLVVHSVLIFTRSVNRSVFSLSYIQKQAQDTLRTNFGDWITQNTFGGGLSCMWPRLPSRAILKVPPTFIFARNSVMLKFNKTFSTFLGWLLIIFLCTTLWNKLSLKIFLWIFAFLAILAPGPVFCFWESCPKTNW